MKQNRGNHAESQYKQLGRLRDDINNKQKIIDELTESVTQIFFFCSSNLWNLFTILYLFPLILVKIRGWLWNYNNCVQSLLAWKVGSVRKVPDWKSSSKFLHTNTYDYLIDLNLNKCFMGQLMILTDWLSVCLSTHT